MPSPSKGKKVEDSDLRHRLDQDAERRNHGRVQDTLDAVYRVFSWIIYAIPFVSLIGVLIVVAHWIYENNWDALTSNIEKFLLLVFGYVASHLERIGVRRKE